MNTKMIMNKPIYVALAQRKDQRRAQLEAQYAQRNAAMRGMQPGMNPVFPPTVFFPSSRGGFMMHPMVQGRGGRYPGGGRGFPQQNYMPMNNRGRGGMRGKIAPGRGGDHNYPGGFKYNPNVRNPTQPVPPPNMPDQIQPQVPDKQLLGEQIYVQLQSFLKQMGEDDNLAGKITGMFLESMALPDLLDLIDSPQNLQRNLNEALKILKQHGIVKKE